MAVTLKGRLFNLTPDEAKTYEALNKALELSFIGQKMYDDLNKVFIALDTAREHVQKAGGK